MSCGCHVGLVLRLGAVDQKGREMLEPYDDQILLAPAFDSAWYITMYAGHTGNIEPDIMHYINHGAQAGFNPNPFFDSAWYLRKYPDVAAQMMNPLKHYLLYGASEGRDPSLQFSTAAYLRNNPDVAIDGGNPLVHFIQFGRKEGRLLQTDAGIWQKIEAVCQDAISFEQAGGVYDLLLQKHVEPSGQPYGFISTGSDPQLIARCDTPAGFFRLFLAIDYDEISPSYAFGSTLQLFIGDEDGFREENSWSYPIVNSRIRIDEILFNAKSFAYLRLDPIDNRSMFRLRRFELKSINVEEALPRVVRNLIERKGHDLDRSFISPAMFSRENIRQTISVQSSSLDNVENSYEKWRSARSSTDFDWSAHLRWLEKHDATPLFSIIMPVYKSDLFFLRKAIESVIRQTYPKWELILIDDGSKSDTLNEFICDVASKDARVKHRTLLRNEGISAASNIGIAQAAGEFIVLVDHDDEIAEHALSAVAYTLATNREADLLYSDEDKIDVHGNHYGPLFKPDWSPEFFLGCMYTCHLSVARKKLVQQLGGFRTAFDFAQDYDLRLRLTQASGKIVHIPDILYHWRAVETSTAGGAEAKPLAAKRAQSALEDMLLSQGLSGIVEEGPFTGSHRVRLAMSSAPLVSIVIPSAARRIVDTREEWYLSNLIQSLKKSTYTNFEVVIVHNNNLEVGLLERLQGDHIRLVEYNATILNISEKMNLGVNATLGELVVLLNDDMTCVSEDWIENMAMWFERPGVVGVGAKLLFPNNTIQHAGVLMLAQGPSHVYYGSDLAEKGLAGSAVLARNYSALTGACLMVRRQDYLAIGGFDIFFRLNYNDVDFCLKLSRLGRFVFEPNAIFYHYESVSKDEAPAEELSLFNKRWSDVVGFDVFYNRNLSQKSSSNQIAFPPRTFANDYGFDL